MLSYKKCKDFAEVLSYTLLGISLCGEKVFGEFYYIPIIMITCMFGMFVKND